MCGKLETNESWRFRELDFIILQVSVAVVDISMDSKSVDNDSDTSKHQPNWLSSFKGF